MNLFEDPIQHKYFKLVKNKYKSKKGSHMIEHTLLTISNKLGIREHLYILQIQRHVIEE